MLPALFTPQEACIRLPWVLWSIVVSDLVIWATYFWMPISVRRVEKRLRAAGVALPWPPLWALGKLFVTACGLTHLMAVMVVFWVVFRLLLGVLLVTALASIVTASMLHLLVPTIARALIELQILRREIATQRSLMESSPR